MEKFGNNTSKGSFMKKKILIGIKIFVILIITFCAIFIGVDKLKKYIRQINMYKNHNINIVFTTDINYVPFTKVAIKSAIINKNKDSVYNINVLCVDLPNSECKSFENLKAENANIYTKPLKLESISHIGNYKMEHYVTRADLFKFLMPDIFPELDKILYIDSDVMIQKDLANLYNTDVTDYYLGAVRKFISPTIDVFLFANIFARIEITHYNCGVLLLNLDKLRKDNIKEKLIYAKNHDMFRRLQTQQSFNDVIPYKTTKHLSPIYNAITRISDLDFYMLNFRSLYKPYLNKIYSTNELFDQAVIIHFAGEEKPWNTRNIRYFKQWWNYANLVNPKWKFGDFGILKP